MPRINIKGLDQAEVLAILHAHALPGKGTARFFYTEKPISVGLARAMLFYAPKDYYFDYVEGRALKFQFNGDMLDTTAYDRENGKGAAKKALANIKNKA